MNILIELDIYCTFTTHGHWADPESGDIHPGHFFVSDHGTCLFPAIRRVREHPRFLPATYLAVECGHILPTPIDDGSPTIVWYRGILGALYSQWKRNHEADPALTMEAFLNRELLINERTTGLGLSPQDYWSLYYFLWVHSAGHWAPFCFDALKENPLPGLHALLDFLGETRTDEQVLAAVEASRVDKIIIDHPEEARPFFRLGDTAEGQRCFPPECIPLLGSLPGMALAHLEGKAVLRVDSMPWPELLDQAAITGNALPPDGLLQWLEEKNWPSVHATCTAEEQGNATARLVLLALRWTTQLHDSPLSFHQRYTSPSMEATFKVILYVLSHAAVPGLVQLVAEREALRQASLSQTLEQLEADLRAQKEQTATLRSRLVQATRNQAARTEMNRPS